MGDLRCSPRVLHRTELAFSQAGLRGPGSCQRQRFLSRKCRPLPTSSLEGGLGTPYLSVLNVSHGVHIFSLPHKREFFCLLGKVEVAYT